MVKVRCPRPPPATFLLHPAPQRSGRLLSFHARMSPLMTGGKLVTLCWKLQQPGRFGPLFQPTSWWLHPPEAALDHCRGTIRFPMAAPCQPGAVLGPRNQLDSGSALAPTPCGTSVEGTSMHTHTCAHLYAHLHAQMHAHVERMGTWCVRTRSVHARGRSWGGAHQAQAPTSHGHCLQEWKVLH